MLSESIDATDCAERAVGRGQANTRAIMVEAKKRGGGFGWAAQACVTLTTGGFNDWFLPSRDELHYMYGNLHMKGLGNFRNDRYWTSTSSIAYSYFWIENMSDGSQDTSSGTNEYYVRPIRQVPGPAGAARSSVSGGTVGGDGGSGNGGTAVASKENAPGFVVVLGLIILGLIGWGIYAAITSPDDGNLRAATAWR
jgi:hypothetical protein